jgi:superfamily I DNA and RNA helicase
MVQPSPLRSRSPLVRLDGNQQQQHDQDQLDLYSDGGRSTRSNTRKIRRTIREEEDNNPYCDVDYDDDISSDSSTSSSITSLTPATGSTDTDIIIVDHTATMVTTKKKKATTTATTRTAAVVTDSSRKTRAKKATQKKTKHKNPNHTEGRWKPWEHIEFLKGLRREGKGKWKAIGMAISTRYVYILYHFLHHSQ